MNILATIVHGIYIALATFVLGFHIFASNIEQHRTPPFPTAAPGPTAVQRTHATTTLPALVAAATTTVPIKSPVVVTATTKLRTVPSAASSTQASAPSATQAPRPAAPAAPAKDPIAVNAETRAAVVNILCTTQAGGYVSPISGSGVFVDHRGIIMTNAHVAEYFLLKDYPVSNNITCVVRTGSPAVPAYTAELLYISPEWIATNAKQLGSEVQTGTGENDFAFLRVTGTTNPNGTLPATFPALPMANMVPDTGASVLAAAYPAGFLEGITIEKSLYSTSAFTTVQQLFTFNSPTDVDVVALKGSVVAQAGSSGGAAVLASTGQLIGLISTEVVATTTSDRILNAITINYIDRALKAKGFGGITGLLTGDAVAAAHTFNTDVAPLLTAKLVAALTKNNH